MKAGRARNVVWRGEKARGVALSISMYMGGGVDIANVALCAGAAAWHRQRIVGGA